MAPRSILITGSNRGLGLEFVKQWVQQDPPPEHIIATCRFPDEAVELNNIAKQHPSVKILQLEVTDYDKHHSIAEQVESIVGKDKGLNLLINNAGVLLNEGSLDNLQVASMIDGFEVNCVAPLMLTRALLPLLQTAADKKTGKRSADRAAVIQISSSLGSIKDNNDAPLDGHAIPRYYTYRCSKAALNMATKNLSIDMEQSGILVAVIHPGWVKTDMGGKIASLEPEESISMMIKKISSLNDKDHGEFLSYDDSLMNW